MEVTLGEREYVRYFGTDSALEAYQSYWKFDGGGESLWSYVLEKAAIGLGVDKPCTPEQMENQNNIIEEVAGQLRLGAASEAVMSAKYNAGVEYGVEVACVVKYDEMVDMYVLRDALGMECTYYVEMLVDIQDVVRWLASTWREYEG